MPVQFGSASIGKDGMPWVCHILKFKPVWGDALAKLGVNSARMNTGRTIINRETEIFRRIL